MLTLNIKSSTYKFLTWIYKVLIFQNCMSWILETSKLSMILGACYIPAYLIKWNLSIQVPLESSFYTLNTIWCLPSILWISWSSFPYSSSKFCSNLSFSFSNIKVCDSRLSHFWLLSMDLSLSPLNINIIVQVFNVLSFLLFFFLSNVL